MDKKLIADSSAQNDSKPNVGSSCFLSWIKNANKLGKYYTTYFGYRISITKKGSVEIIGNKTIFTEGQYVAINKTGNKITGKLSTVISKIDLLQFKKTYK